MDIKVPFLSRKEKEDTKPDIEMALTGWVDICGIIENRYLVIVGWAFHPGIESLDFTLYALGKDEGSKEKFERLKVEIIRVARKDVNQHFSYNGSEKWGFCLIADWPYDSLPEENDLRLIIEGHEVKIAPSLKTFGELRGGDLFGLCSHWITLEKMYFFEWLYRVMGNNIYEISSLKSVEEGQLRKIFNWNWESVLVIPEQGIFLIGWLLDAQHKISTMALRTADGSYSSNLLESSVRFMRSDVLEAFPSAATSEYKAGLYTWIPMPEITGTSALEVVVLTYDGMKSVIPLHQEVAQTNVTLASQKILANFDIQDRNYRAVMRNHIDVALSSLWKYRRRMIAEPEVEILQFGPVVKNPKRSVIVPIYGRYDFLLHQVAQFVSDSDFKETELIYVLDDPRLYNEFIPFCRDTSNIFPVSFKVVYCGYNLGYAGANNLGARIASASRLVLLNSDVIPSEPGWITRIENKAAGLDSVGVVAPKLVFDDGTIQHIGMTFVKLPEFGSLWMNEHPGKGNPEWLMDIQDISESPAVTGACMFIEKSLYDSVGGLEENYVFGDFEDSDLCLKLREAGYRHYVLGNEKLYHLERQSQNLFDNQDWKFKITLYNAWQHTERWGRLIENLVK